MRGTEGLERVLLRARLQARRLVVPDENATWALTAVPAAIRIVREHGIDAVLTTSPRGSVHLVGAAVKRATGVRWVADLRDSLVAHAHRRADTTATRAKAACTPGRAARRVLRRRDHLRLRGDLGGDPRARAARACGDDPERLRLRRCRRSRAASIGALPDHAHGKLLRTPRPKAVLAGARRLGPRRRAPASSVTSARPIASGQSGLDWVTGSS